LVIAVTAGPPMRVLNPNPNQQGKGIMASIRKRNDWDDPEAEKADKEDERVLLSAFAAIIVIWGAAFLLM
jgi:hypothetical protein